MTGAQLAALAGQGRGPAEPVVLADRPDGTVVRAGDVVAKAHAPDTDADALAVRLATAASPLLTDVLLRPLGPGAPSSLDDGRPASLWPLGRAVDPDNPDSAPWEAAGELLARLHSVPVRDLAGHLPGPVPPMRGPVKAARAVARMRAAFRHGPAAPAPAQRAAADAAERAWAGLPPGCGRDAPYGHGVPYGQAATAMALCHGDFHLGQLVRHPVPYGPWRLIDIDDLGLGDPAWDLARPAAWFAAGLLAPESWSRFLGAYERIRGCAGGGDPWAVLDVPARALTVQTVALAVAKAHTAGRPFDEAEEACVDACARIAALTPTRATTVPAPAPERAPAAVPGTAPGAPPASGTPPASVPVVPNSREAAGRRLEGRDATGEPPAVRQAIRPVNGPVGRGE